MRHQRLHPIRPFMLTPHAHRSRHLRQHAHTRKDGLGRHGRDDCAIPGCVPPSTLSHLFFAGDASLFPSQAPSRSLSSCSFVLSCCTRQVRTTNACSTTIRHGALEWPRLRKKWTNLRRYRSRGAQGGMPSCRSGDMRGKMFCHGAPSYRTISENNSKNNGSGDCRLSTSWVSCMPEKVLRTGGGGVEPFFDEYQTLMFILLIPATIYLSALPSSVLRILLTPTTAASVPFQSSSRSSSLFL